jgi:hypothetical protein
MTRVTFIWRNCELVRAPLRRRSWIQAVALWARTHAVLRREAYSKHA